MSFARIFTVAVALFGIERVSFQVNAHGIITQVSADGTTAKGPDIYYAPDPVNSETPVRVMYKPSSPAYVLPSGYTDNSKMSCEGSANAPAPKTLSVNAGEAVTIQWTGATSELLNQPGTGGVTGRNPWVHAMGPVMSYMTSCNGDCTSFDSTNAGWTKIAEAGLDMSQAISSDLRSTMKAKPETYYPTSGNGLWAMAQLVQDGSVWLVTVPSSLVSGSYLIRHEIVAVHNPLRSGDDTTGPQHYIGCIQVNVIGSGSQSLPSGTQAKDLYDPTGTFAKYSVLGNDVTNFTLPGPAVWSGASGSSSSQTASSSVEVTSSSTSTKAVISSTKTAPTSTSHAVTTTSSTSTSAISTTSSASGTCRRRRRRSESMTQKRRVDHKRVTTRN